MKKSVVAATALSMLLATGCSSQRSGVYEPSPLQNRQSQGSSSQGSGSQEPGPLGGRKALGSQQAVAQPSSPRPLPEIQTSFMPEGIDINTEVLPVGFTGADPQSAVEWFRNSLSQSPVKIDQYSTAEERAQFVQYAAQQIDSRGLMLFMLRPAQCQKEYNPNTQVFTFKLYSSTIPRSLEFNTLSILTEKKSLGNYEASNAFGVKVTVERISIRELSLAFVGVHLMRSIKYNFDVSVTSSEARESNMDIRCIALFKISSPYILDYSSGPSTPTINSPSSISLQGTALVGTIRELWIINQRNGKIYKKFKES
jgi:hypothetical protein